MRQKSSLLGGVVGTALALSFGTAQADPLPAGWTTNGNAGTFTAADGVVTQAPGFTSYQWVSTNGAPVGGGTLPTGAVGTETNGSTMTTPIFTVAVGDQLKFQFNYITSDGAGFSDYAWAGLFNGPASFDSYLFTARTTTTGDTVPGFGLPILGAGVTLLPSTTPIIPGGPAFSPLGNSSGGCWDDGCGYTGWVEMDYTFTTAGTYSLKFGVTNWLDDGFDSAFAVAGVTINDVSIDDDNKVPEPATLALVGISLAGLSVLRRRRKV